VTDARGLPGREWFSILSTRPAGSPATPVKTLPGVREASTRRLDEANQYAVVTAAVLASYCDRLDELSALLKAR